MTRPRSEAVIVDQGPESKAARAVFTARSMSSEPPRATCPSTSPVDGS